MLKLQKQHKNTVKENRSKISFGLNIGLMSLAKNLPYIYDGRAFVFQLRLEPEGGIVKVSVTLTCFTAVNLLPEDCPAEVKISKETEESFKIAKTFQRPQEVGRLHIKIIKAEGGI